MVQVISCPGGRVEGVHTPSLTFHWKMITLSHTQAERKTGAAGLWPQAAAEEVEKAPRPPQTNAIILRNMR